MTFSANEQKHAWRYCELHANQRMTVFNFYVVFAGLLLNRLVLVFDQDFPYPQLRIGIGLLLAITSFAFLGLDARTIDLIENAGGAFAGWEADTIAGAQDPAATQEHALFSLQRERNGRGYVPRNLETYGQCLRFVFHTISMVGVLAALFAGWAWAYKL